MRIKKAIMKFLLTTGLVCVFSNSAYAADTYLISFEKPVSDGLLWTQQSGLDKYKTINKDINADGVAEKIEIGKESFSGSMSVNAFFKNNMSWNLFSESQIIKNPIFYKDGEYNFPKTYSMQVSFYDFDKDKKPEIIIAFGDGKTKLFTSILKYNKKLMPPFQEIGYFQGQKPIFINKNGEIIAPYGSQGLSLKYAYFKGEIVQKKNNTVIFRIKPLYEYDVSETQLGKINIESTEKQVLKALGKPLKVEENDSFWKYFYYKDLKISISPGEYQVVEIDSTSSRIKLKRGIKIGDNKSKIISLYGKPGYESLQKEHCLEYTSFNENYGITFYLKNNKVYRMKFHENIETGIDRY